MKNEITVIGAGGRIGLPYAVFLAKRFRDTKINGIELRKDYCDQLNFGNMPFIEHGMKEDFEQAINKNLEFTTDLQTAVEKSMAIFIMIGTPLHDGYANMQPLMNLATQLKNMDIDDSVIIIRSTVVPGTTRRFSNLISNPKTTIIYSPERVIEGSSYKEFQSAIPVIIGLDDIYNFDINYEIIQKLYGIASIPLKWEEAEIGKLFANSFRYVQFSLANEFHRIASAYNIDVHAVLKAFSNNYERFPYISPGLNVGGPCLSKDGHFLEHGNIIINSAYKVNELILEETVEKIISTNNGNNILILGSAFKPEIDDDRDSAIHSFINKFDSSYNIGIYDPYMNKDQILSDHNITNANYIIIMTPHKVFRNVVYQKLIKHMNNNVIIVDIWKDFVDYYNSRDRYKNILVSENNDGLYTVKKREFK